MKTLLSRLIREEKGQDIIEYALLAAAISVVAIPTVPAIGTAVNSAYSNITDTGPDAARAAAPRLSRSTAGCSRFRRMSSRFARLVERL